MERIRTDQSQFGPSVTLFRDDVEEILAILNDACESVTISDGNYSFVSLDELIEKRGPRPRELSLKGASPFVSLSIKPRSAVPLSLYAEDLEAAEIPFLRIQQYLRSRGRKLALPSAVPWVLLGFGIIASIAFQRRPDVFPPWIPLVFFFAGTVGSTIVMSAHGFFTRIRLERRHQATTFWSRNGERLIVGFIGVLLGALGKELATWVAKMLK